MLALTLLALPNQVIPNRERLAEVGLSESEVGAMVEAA